MIELKDLCKSYKTGDFVQTALDHVSTSFRDNEFVAVLGPSGSGKTTLLNVLGGLDHTDYGDLVINGVSTKDYKSADWDTYRNHHIGFIFQSYNLIPHQSILSNVELALTLTGVSRAERKKRAIEELERVGLGEHIHKKPSQLSGGQMQRVAIARALVNNPDIVLADEPTGALDTETGVQVMDLLKEIASDRLVIMVTHNPDLAYEYANRIIKLHDGRVVDDSNPFAPQQASFADDTEIPGGRKKHASMSFLTALGLSFNNLMTKKGRTFLTAFAGSIGIIGIAAILALSNGVNNYIAKVEEDTLSSTPLTITKSSFDITSIITQAGSYEHGSGGSDSDGQSADQNAIPESTIMADILTGVKNNDLKSLRAFLEADEGNLKRYTNAVVYNYGIEPQIYESDTSAGVKRLNPGSLTGMISNGINTSSSFSSLASSNSFQEMLDDSTLLENQYDVVAGHWPSSYDECILVLNSDGGVSDYTLYSLGVLDPDQLEDMLKKALASEEMNVPNTKVNFTYDQALGLSFKVVNKCNMYTKMSDGSTWANRADDEDYMKNQIAKGTSLKIVGIVKPNPSASTTSLSEGIGYRHDLVLHLMDEAASSDVVKAQQADSKTDIFTGKTFEELKNNASNAFDTSSLFSVDEDAMANAFNVDTSAIEDAMASAMGGAGSGVDSSSMFSDIPVPDFSTMDLSGIQDATAQSMAQQAAITQTATANAMPRIMGEFMVWAPSHGYDLTSQMSEAYAAYQQTGKPSSIMQEEIAAATAASGFDQDAASRQLEAAFATAIQTKMDDYMSTQFAPYMQSKMGSLMQSYTANLANSMASALSDAMGSAMSFDADAFASAIHVNMDQGELTSMLTSFATANEQTYTNNLAKIGYADAADPESISIYAKSFDDKEKVKDGIEQYNANMEATGESDKSISYSDIMGVLMSSVTDIVNMISMVLIAFVAISLVVSSIMIGIITYISVLERKKEIGILRAMGASKGNIANIFNAETFIEGLMSGVFAILMVVLVSFPVNAIIMAWRNIDGIMSLPASSALVLVLISVILTFIAGIMPAMNAARRDPVEALRSE